MSGDPVPTGDTTFHLAVGSLSVGILIAALILQIEPSGHVSCAGMGTLPELCWMKKYYGWDCPGCGLTRSFISLSRGELVRAWQYNSGGPLLFLLIAIQIPYRTWRYFSLKKGNPEIPRQGWHWWPMGLALAWLIAQWLIRLAAGNL